MTENQKLRIKELKQQVKDCPPGKALHIMGKEKLEELLKLELMANAKKAKPKPTAKTKAKATNVKSKSKTKRKSN